MKLLGKLILTVALAGVAWLAWQSPLPAPVPAPVQATLPAPAENMIPSNRNSTGDSSSALPKPQLWRVITHRVISKEGIAALQHRLLSMHEKPISIQSMEDVTMHAFDDAVLFKSRAQAQAIALFWQQHGIETNVIKADKSVYLVGLGRLFQAIYAKGMQKQLDRVGRKYRYQQRIVPIPVRRFTFSPGTRQEAEKLWKKLSITGVMMPALIAETQFQELYGSSIQ